MDSLPPLDRLTTLLAETPPLTLLLGIGAVGFVIYRTVDFLQARFVRQQSQPRDLERLDRATFVEKRLRKATRSTRHFWMASLSWLVQVAYVASMPFLISVLQRWAVSDGWIYTGLIVATFLLNMVLSRVLSLHNPVRPCACRSFQRERTWRAGNVTFHAFGVVSWAVPVYFLWEAFGVSGWIGSVLLTFVAQVAQLTLFIFVLKRTVVPYLDSERLSSEFKENMQGYLASQGFSDREVGVLENSGMGPNAFATSLFGYRQIVLTEELATGFRDPTNPDFELRLEDDSLEAVTAHEVGHIRHRHVEKSVFVGALLTSAVTVAVYQLFSGSPESYVVFDEGTSQQLLLYWGQSIFNAMLVFPLTFLVLFLGRRNETQADTHLLETNACKNGEDFFHQIRHIAPVPNLALWHRLNATHPPPEDREMRMRVHTATNCGLTEDRKFQSEE